MRIEEKFKNFRIAFRSFDKNYDGNLSFKEFMNGLENIGIRLNLEDFLTIFKSLDFDNKGEIDFSKFCHLNTDKLKDIHNYILELKK
jgi:Ca2+-binding EF-hand superfamily protein